MKAIQFIDARSAHEAVRLLRKYGKRAQLFASGADVLYMLKDRIEGPAVQQPEILIHLGKIPDLNRIVELPDGGVKLGPTVRLIDLIGSSFICNNFSLLSRAAERIASPQLRNTSTVAGNLCQKPRCWYYRTPDIICLKKGGSTCWAIEGDNRYYHAIVEGGPCHIVHPSDLAPCLVSLNARVHILSAERNAEKELAVEDFFTTTANSLYQENVLGPNEMIVNISIPPTFSAFRQVFEKATVRQSDEFALVSVALAARFQGRICADSRITFGGVSPRPYRAHVAEDALRNVDPTDDNVTHAAKAAFSEAKPMTMNAYKLDLAAGLLLRAFRAARSFR